jgi:DDE superfamily endonuclease
MSELGPEFDAQAATVCGLYLGPPEGALVVSIDEKTGIQAKAPTRPDLQARPGKPARREYEYPRNGTQNLFAALRVHSGEVSAMPSKTRNRYDLLRFLDQLETEIPDAQQVIAITDNLSTRTEVEQWLNDHPHWQFVLERFNSSTGQTLNGWSRSRDSLADKRRGAPEGTRTAIRSLRVRELSEDRRVGLLEMLSGRGACGALGLCSDVDLWCDAELCQERRRVEVALEGADLAVSDFIDVAEVDRYRASRRRDFASGRAERPGLCSSAGVLHHDVVA